MTITDIEKRQNKERKREKRLVHLTNSLSRDFISSKILKSKSSAGKNTADYIVKSFLDFIFFNEHKEIGEINEVLIKSFLVDWAPRNLQITKLAAKNLPNTLIHFLEFLHADGYHKNVAPLIQTTEENTSIFLATYGKASKLRDKKKSAVVVAKKVETVVVGRNDPCPCGSGKKYKKCCGRTVE